MKKRLLSLLVALCMAVTLLPVSAITAWAEEGGSTLKPLQIQSGYPVLDDITPTTNSDGHEIYTGDGWSYDATAKVLTIAPEKPTTYDLKECGNIRLDPKSILCSAIIRKNAEIVNGKFWNAENPGSSITNDGTITSGVYSMPVINHGTITGGMFSSTVTNTGTIKGGIFHKKPEDGQVADGYTLKVNSQQNGSYESFDTEISYFGNSGYVIPNSNHNTSITIYISLKNSQAILFPIDVTFGDSNDTHCLLEDWAPSARYYDDGRGSFSVTFTAPPATADTVTLSILTRLVIDKDGYPVGTKGGTQDYSGNGWKFEASNKTLTLTSGSYDFSGEENALRPLNPNVHLVVESGAMLTGGAFKNKPTGEGAGTFKTVILNGTGSITAVNGLTSDWGKTLYAVKTGYNTITASKPILDINRILLENDDPIYSSNKNTVRIDIESLSYMSALDPNADIILNQASHGLSLSMDRDGTPVIVNAPFEVDGNYYNYYGDGWKVNKVYDGMNHGTLYLTGGKTYNFRFTDPVNKTGQLDAVKCGIINEGSTIEDGVFNTLAANGLPNSTSSMTPKIKGGTFAAGLYYNNGEITGGVFNGKDSIFTQGTVLSGNYRSVTVKDGAILKVNDTLPLIYDETTHDLVQGLAWDLYSYAGTVLTVEADADITNINGQKIGKAFNSSYPNGETDKTVVRFEMPDSDVELNSTKIVDPDPKPEPKPEPEPEAPTYTLTVKGGTFTYNGGEAMTSASVPVDAEVKVTLNQSAVPEGMVFDLWAMDEASLLGNPAVAYNEESFTIPAGSVAKGSTVTVEAQYRDATIESEPSILGTAAIIGVAGAGTAVIVWQGYRIGMELYEKYFQPTPEETAAEQAAPEAPAAAAAS
ncbi:hypothetical protein [Faecalibacterium sp. Marseille-Q0746]|uniref:hypothetical protein n=1 Tax=Faecalibacterium sp. Marseille-Q0746 TaxID=2817019 RepID=UPI001A9B7DCF|nr:hypothetical protein [Faecalibacterium sp. Marseille-Q0746]MBO1343921.1 hypothetical protein [Faecalibacterium sp. Marseille-Q0746]